MDTFLKNEDETIFATNEDEDIFAYFEFMVAQEGYEHSIALETPSLDPPTLLVYDPDTQEWELDTIHYLATRKYSEIRDAHKLKLFTATKSLAQVNEANATTKIQKIRLESSIMIQHAIDIMC